MINFCHGTRPENVYQIRTANYQHGGGGLGPHDRNGNQHVWLIAHIVQPWDSIKQTKATQRRENFNGLRGEWLKNSCMLVLVLRTSDDRNGFRVVSFGSGATELVCRCS
jgi:hypothetical protein